MRLSRFQFSLRTLLIFVTLLAIPCWYVGEQFRIVQRRNAVLAKVRELGEHHYIRVADGQAESWIRKLFGDEPHDLILIPVKATTEELHEVNAAFPEATVSRYNW